MRRKDLVPLKVVVEELCVSRITIWRARQSGIPDFPEPVTSGGQVFWRKKDLEKLEDALLRFKGRIVFERAREARTKVEKLKRAQTTLRRRAPRLPVAPSPNQSDLFDR